MISQIASFVVAVLGLWMFFLRMAMLGIGSSFLLNDFNSIRDYAFFGSMMYFLFVFTRTLMAVKSGSDASGISIHANGSSRLFWLCLGYIIVCFILVASHIITTVGYMGILWSFFFFSSLLYLVMIDLHPSFQRVRFLEVILNTHPSNQESNSVKSSSLQSKTESHPQRVAQWVIVGINGQYKGYEFPFDEDITFGTNPKLCSVVFDKLQYPFFGENGYKLLHPNGSGEPRLLSRDFESTNPGGGWLDCTIHNGRIDLGYGQLFQLKALT